METGDEVPGATEVRSIAVTGIGRQMIAPDIAEIVVGVWTESPDSRKAVEANSRQVAKVFAAVAEAGIPKRDLQTSRFTIQPRFTNPTKRARRIVGYSVGNSVTVTIRRIDDVSSVLSRVLKFGVNAVSGPYFRVGDPSSVEDACRRLAIRDALNKAKLFAGQLGARVGAPRSIREGGGRDFRQQMLYSRVDAMSPDSGGHAPPIAGGEQEIEVQVSVVFDLIVDVLSEG